MEEINGKAEPQNRDPDFILALFDTAVGFLQVYGWAIIFVVIGALYLYSKFWPKVYSLAQTSEEDRYKKIDAGLAQERAEAMERARRKMQEEQDAQAREFAENQKQKDEAKRQQKIEDWDRQQQGKGYKSRTKVPEDKPSTSASTPTSKPKKSLKPEYNPLMGGGGVCYRPARRGGCASGGG